MRAGAIAIGSNSVRMLIADVCGETGYKVLRDREGTRLFAGLDEKHNLSEPAMRSTASAVARMAQDARDLDCKEISLFATSATRDAANKADLKKLLFEASGLEMEVTSGEDEARLSFIGAASGAGSGYCGVIDIGGGSTEIVTGDISDASRNGISYAEKCAGAIRCAFSCQMGAVRLHGIAPITSHGDLPAVEQVAADILERKLMEHPTLTLPAKWYGTGGTFTTLAAMVKSIRWTDRTYMHGTVLTLAAVQEKERQLSDMTMAERLQLPGLQPHRADIVVHGICILSAVMQRLNIGQITVSEYGNLDGYLKVKYGIKGEILPKN